ncbi:uncharacterized protein LOC131649353 [Vicia villosa]|uniref:uncharacterized protein LOC131649353 n=1 Tax=Vicia villosa TaxID=3911 RepID=UPI00273B22EB|nr:uncharacterized protein LOC131649353 [Vicia villosa]
MDAFDLVWGMDVPFKIKAFGWRLFHSRLPMKDLLELRGMPLSVDDLKCIFCGVCKENRDHLFFGCLVVKNIWNEIAFWVDKGAFSVEECFSNFMDWHLFFHSKLVLDRKLDIIWFATTWCIWLVRNGACFRKEAWSVNSTLFGTSSCWLGDGRFVEKLLNPIIPYTSFVRIRCTISRNVIG